MEYVEGISLDRYLIDKTTLPEMQARKIAAQLCDAVGYIHSKQIIHRDLKPANIMVSADGACVKIIDFGLSDSSSYVNLKYRGGTPAFGAPEQFASTCDYRADIFSLGKIFRLLLPQRRYRAVLARCTENDPDNRWPDAATLKRRLLDVSDAKVRRRNLLTAVAACIAGLAIGYLALGLHRNNTEVATAGSVLSEQGANIEKREAEDAQREALRIRIDSLAGYAAEYTRSELPQWLHGR